MTTTAPAAPARTSGAPVTPQTGESEGTARLRRRRVAVVVGALLLLALACAASLAWGARDIAPGQVWRALVDPVAGDNDHLVVRDLRVPRTLVGLVGGAAFAAAGVLLQGVTRNPIADPGLLGINAGASLAVVVAIALGASSIGAYVWCAFAGAVLAALVVHLAASLSGDGPTPVTLALVGAAFSALATSAITVVLLTDQRTLGEFRSWQVGSLANRSLDLLPPVLPFVVLGVVLAVAAAPVLDALALGDDVAAALGVRVGRGRALVLLAVVLLCGSAVSLVGPIAFVGLVVPHLARMLVGAHDHRWLLGVSLLLGPSLLLAADVIGRLLAPPGEVEAGLVVAVLGAPVLLAIVRRGRVLA
ncbi:iron chelate uptake ABC transporter family permease subunit [Nocardioides fonticola]|uniref:Iron chelate uptake ABC transporter family permease subunit n=1 Tax=Nocardioides fonticola TaxID=450363 RepID=A0ABP7XBS8_9ACTN